MAEDQDDAGPVASRKLTRTEKAAAVFAWQRAAKRCPTLKPIDAMTVLDACELADDDLTFFRSAAKLAREIRCTKNTAAASLARLAAAGLLERAATSKGTAGPKGGRRANTFRICMPAEGEVLPNPLGKTDDVVLPSQLGETNTTEGEVLPNQLGRVLPNPLGETNTTEGEVLPNQLGRVLPNPLGTNTLEQSLEGAGAHRARPAPHSGDTVIEEGADAHERAPASLPPASVNPAFASELTEPAPVNIGGRPITQDDLDRLAAEEQAAAQSPQAIAAAALAVALGDRLLDYRAFVADMIAAFIDRDAEAEAHVGEVVAGMLFDLGRAEAGRLWTALRAISFDLFEALDPDRAAEADVDFRDAVRDAGEAEMAARREARAEAEAETTPVTAAAIED